MSPPRPRCSQLRPPPPPYPCAALSLCMSLCLSLSLSERGKRKKQRFLKIFSPVILEPLTTRKVTQFVASRFSLIFSLGGSRKKLKIATKVGNTGRAHISDRQLKQQIGIYRSQRAAGCLHPFIPKNARPRSGYFGALLVSFRLPELAVVCSRLLPLPGTERYCMWPVAHAHNCIKRIPSAD